MELYIWQMWFWSQHKKMITITKIK
uniref:Uncharacterized protein n=1 Tax=Anguilla anguilla TaxID=7936 RepID=A0A0E9WEQ5_ANGAN